MGSFAIFDPRVFDPLQMPTFESRQVYMNKTASILSFPKTNPPSLNTPYSVEKDPSPYCFKEVVGIIELARIIWSYLEPSDKAPLTRITRTNTHSWRILIGEDKAQEIEELQKFVSSIVSYLKRKELSNQIKPLKNKLKECVEVINLSLSANISYSRLHYEITKAHSALAPILLKINSAYTGISQLSSIQNKYICLNVREWMVYGSECSPSFREGLWGFIDAYEEAYYKELNSRYIENRIINIKELAKDRFWRPHLNFFLNELNYRLQNRENITRLSPDCDLDWTREEEPKNVLPYFFSKSAQHLMECEQFDLAIKYADHLVFSDTASDLIHYNRLNKKIIDSEMKAIIIYLIERVKDEHHGVFLELSSLKERLQYWKDNSKALKYIWGMGIFDLSTFFFQLVHQRIKKEHFDKALALAHYMKENEKWHIAYCGGPSMQGLPQKLFLQITVALCQKKDFDAAKDVIEKHLLNNCGCVYNHLLRSTSFLSSQNQLSIPLLKELTFHSLAYNALDKGRPFLAQKIFEEELALKQGEGGLIAITQRTLLKILLALVQKGKLKEATELSNKYGGNAERLIEEGFYYLKQNNIDKAEETLNTIKSMHKDAKIKQLSDAIAFSKILK